ncbi:hypothetical protein DRN69_06920 [Candidatus Pacearchaeota archaeon]|nr:MAG: hypothetical protein DRN69_06920 [Candidatus Pacearchaeota archaeon]
MEECFICGVPENRAVLIEAILDKGIRKVCKSCLSKENLPKIKKIYSPFVKEERKTVYERLSKFAGINPEERRKEKNHELVNQELALRDIVEENFKRNLLESRKENPNLIRNFHWVIMRARRLKKLTQKQFAEAISEPEIAIKMAEQGILPKEGDKLVKKIENYLNINICREKPETTSINTQNQRLKEVQIEEGKKDSEEIDISFDPVSMRNLTIADLQKIKKIKEKEIFESKEDKKSQEKSSDKDL